MAHDWALSTMICNRPLSSMNKIQKMSHNYRGRRMLIILVIFKKIKLKLSETINIIVSLLVEERTQYFYLPKKAMQLDQNTFYSNIKYKLDS